MGLLPFENQIKSIGITLNIFDDYYHKELHLGCCSSPRSASEYNIHNEEMKNIKDTHREKAP